MSLRWRKLRAGGDPANMSHWNVVVDRVLMPGKWLYLEVHQPKKPPEKLEVFQVYESIVRWVLSRAGVHQRRFMVDFTPEPFDGGFRSDSIFELPEVRGVRKSAAYVFTETASGETSGHMFSSRLGNVKAKASAGAAAPAGPGIIHASVGIEADIRFASDPSVELEVLTGAALAEHLMENLRAEFGEEENTWDAIRRTFGDSLSRSIEAASKLPRDWRLTLDSETVSGDEGQDATVVLELAAPSEGTVYFAVRAHVPDTDLYETSDVVAVTVDQEGAVRFIEDLSEMDLPLIA